MLHQVISLSAFNSQNQGMNVQIVIPAAAEPQPDDVVIAMEYLEAVETGEIPELLDDMVQDHLTPYETVLIHVAREFRPA